MTPYYMHNGEKSQISSISYLESGAVGHVMIRYPKDDCTLIFAGEKMFDGEIADEQLEQNIIWEESQ